MPRDINCTCESNSPQYCPVHQAQTKYMPKLVVLKNKKKPVELTATELKTKIQRMHEINLQTKALEKEFEKLEKPVIETLGLKGVFQSEVTDPNDKDETIMLRCTITRQMRRSVPWREITFELARQIYKTRKELFIWLKGIVRKFPKKPTKMWPKITVVKDEPLSKSGREAV